MGSVMKPYSDSVNKSMNDILGIADITLEKKSPEGTLGNFMVDAFYTMAREKHNMAVDVAFINYGGIRLTQLPAGNVTRGKIFEMMLLFNENNTSVAIFFPINQQPPPEILHTA